MTPAGAKEKLETMLAEAERAGECSICHVKEGEAHLRNCVWTSEVDALREFIAKTEPARLEGPNLKWGDPCGTYEIELVPEGAVFFYRQKQMGGGMLEIKVPFSTQALAEMQALVGMIDFGFKVEIPDGRIAGHC